MQSIYDHNIVDKNNRPLPWFSYPSIEYLQQFDLKDKTVFEWGSGNSSLFFADRCKFVTSVESDEIWYRFVKNNSRPNQDVMFITNREEYVSAMKRPYDIVIIDGNFRRDCVSKSLNNLQAAQMIIFDNSNWYVESCGQIRELRDFIQIDFFGMAPLVHYAISTTIFLRRDIRLVPLDNTQPKRPIGGNWIYSHDN